MSKSLLVRASNPSGRVALFEQHPDHPGGQALVAGSATVEVAETPGVMRALADGRLTRVEKPKKPAGPAGDTTAS